MAATIPDPGAGAAVPQHDARLQPLEAQLREAFGRAAYTHKTHQKAADKTSEKLKRIQFCQILLSALTTTSLLIALFGDNKIGTLVGAVLGTALFGLNAYTKDNDLGGIAQKHVEAANRLWVVRESYVSALTDFQTSAIDEAVARARRDELQSELAAIYSSAPPTFSGAYKAAQEALQVNEELTFSDEEIDKLLPAPLGRNSSASSPTSATKR